MADTDNSFEIEVIDPAAEPAPKHIGQDLRDARMAAGLAHFEVSESLRIQPSFIVAIEKLDTAELPSIGYVLGYVRAYAKLLGLNPQEAVERYKIDSEVPENLGMRTMPHFVPERQLRLPRGFFAAVTVMGIAAILAFWYSSQTTPQSAALQSQTRLNTPAPGTSEPVPIDPDLMTFKATAPTWVQIKDKDGKVIISRILVTGESWQTDVDNNVSLSARDSGALELYLGGELMGNLGKKGIPMADVPMPAVPRQEPKLGPKSTPKPEPIKAPSQSAPDPATPISATSNIQGLAQTDNPQPKAAANTALAAQPASANIVPAAAPSAATPSD